MLYTCMWKSSNSTNEIEAWFQKEKKNPSLLFVRMVRVNPVLLRLICSFSIEFLFNISHKKEKLLQNNYWYICQMKKSMIINFWPLKTIFIFIPCSMLLFFYILLAYTYLHCVRHSVYFWDSLGYMLVSFLWSWLIRRFFPHLWWGRFSN